MPLLAKLRSLAALAAATASANPLPPQQKFLNSQITWQTALSPSNGGRGVNVTLRGTIEAVHAQLLQLNPNYDVEAAATAAANAGHQNHSKEKAAEPDGKNTCCRPDDSFAAPGPVAEAVAYLRSQYGVAWNDADGWGRVSCSYGAAVTWCNDTDFLKVMDWLDLADAVQAPRRRMQQEVEGHLRHEGAFQGY